MKGFQHSSPAYNKMVGDMQRLDQVLRELQPVLRTLNEKSNALVFEAAGSQDPQPKKAKNDEMDGSYRRAVTQRLQQRT